MSSANNHKRNTLEDEFQRRLYDAEARPAPDLWARIDHDLTVQENQDYKKRVLFYRQLAAACFVLFALTGTLLAYYYQGGQLNQATQPGLATTAATERATQDAISPEAAMQAYAATQAAEEEKTNAEETEVPQQAKITRPAQKAGVAAAAAVDEPQAGDYYRIGPAYTRYLGYSPFANQRGGSNGGRFAGATPEHNGTQSFFAPEAGYTQIITWERITVTMGSNSGPSQQKAFGNGQALAAKPQSFAEMNEAYQAGRQQQAKQTTEAGQTALASQEKNPSPATSRSTGRWSLNLAYAPSVFEQNIGLPEPASMSSSNDLFSIMIGPTINASEESYQNMTAAREEYNERTQPAFSFAVEAKAGFKLKEKLKILTGIGYSENTSRSKSNYIVRQFWVKPRSNERYELSPSTFFLSSLNDGFTSDSVSVARTGEAFSTSYTYRHLTVPVGLQYEHDLSKDWFVYGGAGVAANFLLESSVTTTHQEVQPVTYSANDSESPFRQVQFSGNASVGVGKRLSNSLTLAMGPEVRHYFNTLVADPDGAAAPQGKPYALGMNMSLNYQLGGGRK
jgi:hypothetical protein